MGQEVEVLLQILPLVLQLGLRQVLLEVLPLVLQLDIQLVVLLESDRSHDFPFSFFFFIMSRTGAISCEVGSVVAASSNPVI